MASLFCTMFMFMARLVCLGSDCPRGLRGSPRIPEGVAAAVGIAAWDRGTDLSQEKVPVARPALQPFWEQKECVWVDGGS